jgi:hypothetical protein
MGELARKIASAFLFLLITSLAGVAYGQTKIVGISIACSNDHVYTWYSDGTVSVGTSENLSDYEAPHSYSMPFGKTPADIIEIGIAGNDRVYTWYRDSTVSVGTSTDLDKYQPRHRFIVPKLESAALIVGIDIACSDDHVYAWYSNGHVSSGTSDNLGQYYENHRFQASGRAPASVVGIGIAGNDYVYAWFSDSMASSGTSEDFRRHRSPYRYVFGPGPCDISADAPKKDGRDLFAVGIRGPECKSSAGITVRLRTMFADKEGPVLRERQLSGTNFELPVNYVCTGQGSRTLITEVVTLGRTVKSAKTTITDCF